MLTISWGNHININRMSPANGFGYATERIISSLRTIGHTVEYGAREADIEVWFDQPYWIKWKTSNALKVAYFPWESTNLPKDWAKMLNTADQVWVPSEIIAEWLPGAGVTKPISVYHHGVDDVWAPKLRVVDSDFNFFHHGGEALRKGWTITAKMIYENFTSPNDFANFKMQMQGWNVNIPGTNIYNEKMDIDELVALYHQQHLMVYPSWGEGFGLTPLQAMATAMPVLITRGWAPYEYLLPPECLIDSKISPSPWPETHPGKMFEPNLDDMRGKAKNIYNNYERYAQLFTEIAPIVKKDFNWIDITQEVFSSEKLFKNSASSN